MNGTAHHANCLFSFLFSGLFVLAAVACTGNGGAANSNGDVYIPGGSSGGGNPGNISTTSSGDSSDTERFTADDLLKLSKEGDTGRIIQL
ncbi:MAG: hypothetical protein II932_08605, partial [Treponema sp.]|nr:hypothetical protein [Treponema sp.]